MTATHLPSDQQMEAWRLSGRWICTCSVPAPRIIGAFGGHDCIRCWLPILNREQVKDVIANVLDEVGDA